MRLRIYKSISMNEFIYRTKLFVKMLACLVNPTVLFRLSYKDLLDQLVLIGPNSLFIIMITSFFVSLVLSLQIVKEFLYLNATDLVGSVLAISFIRELSPVLTSIIIIGKIGSFFTAEIATMSITEQIDALLILGINPINYLFLPRVFAMILTLPFLNLFSLFTSFISSSFICSVIYSIDSAFFFHSLLYSVFFIDIVKSTLKVLVFGLFISIISYVWGITTKGGSKGVGLSTTSSVVTSLTIVFILNFILSYFMFSDLVSSFEIL
uniref:hypothetical protein Ycf63 n=1 Tax=Aphanocladia delicatula TaxID=3041656 RepID=UPI002551DD38|nr:hypothetical protein Ycf63 [Aphanocladia delicatula]WGH14145.1 hypothetical protein Ycf63 [Aphanocladia delicatula]